MASNLVKAIKNFGILDGIRVYRANKKAKSLSIKIPGANYWVTLRGRTTDISTYKKIFIDKEYDVPLTSEPMYVIDAGAYTGLSPVFFSVKYPDAKIVCIEPETGNYQMLLENTRLQNITCINGAVWNQSGGQKLALVDADKKNSFQVVESPGGSIKSYSIDEIMELHSLPHIDILKLDIEGTELDLFSKGFEKWLPKTKVIMIELHDRYRPGCSDAFYSIMDRFGFRYYTQGENEIAINLNF